MSFKLVASPNNPPLGALAVAELLRSDGKLELSVSWSDVKGPGGIQFFDAKGSLIGENDNEASRYLARAIAPTLYGGTGVLERSEVDHWLSFAIGPLKCSQSEAEALAYLERSLAPKTWLVAKQLTIADFSVFSTLHTQLNFKDGEKYPNITRWYKKIQSLPAVKTSLAAVKKNLKVKAGDTEKSTRMNKAPNRANVSKEQGKFIELPGAETGKVVVRFPPEASGYLHIGHAKAALLNQYYAQNFQGQLIMRFDDTNPAKESVEFEEAILEDLEMLQIKPDRFTHTSEYFDLMLTYCTQLITEGKAYVDDTPAAVMKEQRDQLLPSENRDNTVEKNLKLWEEMKKASDKGTECCVRAKIDYQSPNGCMRDPTIYRCKPEPHPRTGTKYKVYPTYDFACPIVDAIEGVTHTLRTTEYHDRDAQFYWLIEALNLRRPYIWEYSRLNMTHTVLSKRKLAWFVAEGLVDGWDDPRFPTVRGILRRGMTVEGLKQFIIAQGSSKSVVFMEWDKIWAFNKKVINPIATRYTALSHDQTIPVHVSDAVEGWLTVQNHPKDPSLGTKKVRIGPNLLIEKDDAAILVEGQNATFINWGNLLIQKIKKENGIVTEVEAKLNLDNKDFKSTPKLTWLCQDKSNEKNRLIPCYAVYFGHIMSKAVLGKDDDFKNFIAKDTRKEVKVLGELELQRVVKGEIIELQRKGFFRCDVAYAPKSSYSSREQPLILFHVPDGHATSPTTSSATASPTKAPTTKTTTANASEPTGNEIKSRGEQNAEELNAKIIAQGDKVRELKAAKADKKAIDQEVKILLSLKAEYKSAAGADWKPGVAPPAAAKINTGSRSAEIISDEITKQGDKIRILKGEKVDKKTIEAEVKVLLNLKAEYKSATGQDWKPGAVPAKAATNETVPQNQVKTDRSAEIISADIVKQGDKVRELKGQKADKKIVEVEVKTLLNLKAEYKTVTGQDWKPGTLPVKPTVENMQSAEDISNAITKQGDRVRQLKGEKAGKTVIDQEVKALLALKAEYKTKAGADWKPNAVPNTPAKVENKDSGAEEISNQVAKQGEKVRELKAAKADKKKIDDEVKILLNLKAQYKAASGQDWKPSTSTAPAKEAKKVENQSKKPAKTAANANKSANEATVKDKDVTKTGTRLGLEAKKNENLSDWYSQVITKGEMIEYYDVSGCYVLRPWSYSIWEAVKDWFDTEIKKLGVQNCYFPMFVSRTVLEKEKSHIADFAPEVAWVTKSGETELAEPIAIRPTSETVMYPAYAKWLKSHRDLPLKLNQWNNVVRWEFKHPQPFLRTREFLWQEGHTAFATKSEAEEEVLTILELYAKIYEDLLAIPVVRGRKSEKEKFAGGDFTTTVEAFVSASGRAIQGATSHHLGQNFSKMFDIQVLGADENGEKSYVWQNSWGLTTRTIGVMVMIHGDDNGLVLPPKVASVQAVIIPCGITASSTPEQRQNLLTECTKLENELKAGQVKVKGDYRDNYSPGWKFNHWELKGVPLRIELGPKDLEKSQLTVVRRDTFAKVTIPRAQATSHIHKLLEDVQKSLYDRAVKELKEHTKQTEDWNVFCKQLDQKNLILSPYCGEISCEDQIKANSAREDVGEEPGAPAMGAKTLCIPFKQPTPPAPLETLRCIHPKCTSKPKFYALFGRSY